MLLPNGHFGPDSIDSGSLTPVVLGAVEQVTGSSTRGKETSNDSSSSSAKLQNDSSNSSGLVDAASVVTTYTDINENEEETRTRVKNGVQQIDTVQSTNDLVPVVDSGKVVNENTEESNGNADTQVIEHDEEAERGDDEMPFLDTGNDVPKISDLEPMAQDAGLVSDETDEEYVDARDVWSLDDVRDYARKVDDGDLDEEDEDIDLVIGRIANENVDKKTNDNKTEAADGVNDGDHDIEEEANVVNEREASDGVNEKTNDNNSEEISANGIDDDVVENTR
ncbi:unnamed protein product [Ambrosiozyma monospora]|uniref:Unnamed protein product n=1 Tax=Ambrosiozyma monospora TaxID=43982 RepID=A0ACB5U5Y1_AMBMO|nr:unnamed protein product [Ambrosiozyma monospora]